MTNQQTGREAFEAWISAPPFEQSVSRLNASSAWPGSYSDITTDLAWKAWQAALAQQGREVGEAWKVRVLPVVVKGEDDAHRVEMKRGVQSFRVGPDYWDTREEAEAYAGQLRIALAAPKQQAVEVTEEMVKRVMDAGFHRDDAIAATEREAELREALRRIVRTLGPAAPTCAGCSHEISEALEIATAILAASEGKEENDV